MHRSIQLNGQTIPYLDQGDGEVILFLHGILSDHRIWQPYCDSLSHRYRTIAYRLSGFGAENRETIQEQFNTAIHAEELIAFCEALDLTNITLVAWSYSCHVALLAALRNCERIKSILLYELFLPSYGIRANDQAAYGRDLMRMMAPSMRALRQNDLSKAADAFLKAATHDRLSLQSLSPDAQQIKADNLHTLPLLLNQATPETITPEMLQSIERPIQIFWGEKTRDIFKIASKTALSAMDKCRKSSIIEGQDHYLPESDPQCFMAHLFPQ